jgi:hypothetical protein
MQKYKMKYNIDPDKKWDGLNEEKVTEKKELKEEKEEKKEIKVDFPKYVRKLKEVEKEEVE